MKAPWMISLAGVVLAAASALADPPSPVVGPYGAPSCPAPAPLAPTPSERPPSERRPSDRREQNSQNSTRPSQDRDRTPQDARNTPSDTSAQTPSDTAPEATASSSSADAIGAFGGGGYNANNDAVQQRSLFNLRGPFVAGNFEVVAPTDRAYIGYTFMNNIHDLGQHSFDGHTAVFGAEMTFLEKRASAEIRVPFSSLEGGQAIGSDGLGTAGGIGFGDITVLGKYALYKDCQTGDVVSSGLAVTIPTGVDPFLLSKVGDTTFETKVGHGTLLQPFVGYEFFMGRVSVRGFSSIVLPTQAGDVTFLANEIGSGFLVYKPCECDDQMLTSVVTFVDIQVNTPLDHRGGVDHPRPAPDASIYAADQVFISGGVSLGFWKHAYLAVGAVLPITGPKPYDFAITSELGWRF
jgi:hypothetical protein